MVTIDGCNDNDDEQKWLYVLAFYRFNFCSTIIHKKCSGNKHIKIKFIKSFTEKKKKLTKAMYSV